MQRKLGFLTTGPPGGSPQSSLEFRIGGVSGGTGRREGGVPVLFEQLGDQSWEGEAGAGVRAGGGWDLSLGGLSCGGSLLDQPGPSCMFAPRSVMGAMMGGPLPLASSHGVSPGEGQVFLSGPGERGTWADTPTAVQGPGWPCEVGGART